MKMNDNINYFIREFNRIGKKRWIKGIGYGHGNIGMTFENELGKKPDDNYSPDYKGIEIKTTTRFSRYPISLFSVSFENKNADFPEINRLIDLYGYYDKDFKDKKVLFKTVNTIKKSTLINKKFRFQLEIDYETRRLYLCAYNLLGCLCDRFSYITFDKLKEHLEAKLKYLSIVTASKKNIDNEYYFRYYYLKIYALKNFNVFLKLLEEGVIYATIIGRIKKSGINRGKYSNKNLVFKIKKDDIKRLFDIKYFLNLDNPYENNFFIQN